MLYPLKLKPVYKEPIWGGTWLRDKFGKEIPSDSTGESWEIACHPNGISMIDNGHLKGKSLQEVIWQYQEEILGSRIGKEGAEKFPLLVKILDASDKLSVQVHPEDDYAKKYENGELGKTEMWYVIDAKPDAKLVYGVKAGTTPQQFEQAIKDGVLEHYLNFVEVKAGDVFFIPATMLHAIGEGILIAEIQQNSDTTYRVYDWNRTDDEGNPRELHVQKALDVTNLSDVTGREKAEGVTINEGGNKRTFLVACKYFATERIEVQRILQEISHKEKFDMLIFLEGEGKIIAKTGAENFKAGDSFLIPACMGDYSIVGECKLLKSYVPDIKKDVIQPLKNKEIVDARMLKKIGGL